MAFTLKDITPEPVRTSSGEKTSVVVFVPAFVYFTKSVRGSGDAAALTASTVAVTPLVPPVRTLPMTFAEL